MALVIALGIAACSTGQTSDEGTEGTQSVDREQRSWAGSEPAPEFPAGAEWLNTSEPLQLEDLRGRVVLLDFWTLGCINCQHIIPDLKALESEFPQSLVVIGVHSGKYDAEKDPETIRAAIARFDIEHPVVNDPDFEFWNTYGARAWPTLVLIDPGGNLAGIHSGEGVYPLFQPIVADLVAEFDALGRLERKPPPVIGGGSGPATVLSAPAKAVSSTDGRLFVADAGHNRIIAVSPDGSIESVFGDGAEGLKDGPGSDAEFSQPQGLALSDDQSVLYVADTRNHAIRAIDLATGEVSTVAGTGEQLDRLPTGGSSALSTALASPWDVLVREKTLYVSMAGVHQLWTVDLESGDIRVFAGTSREGIEDGDALSMATLAQPSGLTTDGTNLYWVDPESSAVRAIPLAGGAVTTLAGTGLFDFGFADGQREDALLQHPQGLAFAGGILFVSDTYNNRIRTLDVSTGEVRTIAGSDRGWRDGVGDDALFSEPVGISSLPDGRLVVADQANHLLRTLDPATGTVETILLRNPAAAGPGKLLSVSLQPQTVAPGTGNIRIVLNSPADHHLNSLAPSALQLTTSNSSVVAPGESDIRWSSDEALVDIPVPSDFGEGVAELVASGIVYYCRSGEEALCFIQRLELRVPVRVAAGSNGGELKIQFELPEGPG